MTINGELELVAKAFTQPDSLRRDFPAMTLEMRNELKLRQDEKRAEQARLDEQERRRKRAEELARKSKEEQDAAWKAQQEAVAAKIKADEEAKKAVELARKRKEEHDAAWRAQQEENRRLHDQVQRLQSAQVEALLLGEFTCSDSRCSAEGRQ